MNFNENIKLMGKYYKRCVIDRENKKNIDILEKRGLIKIFIIGEELKEYACLTKKGRDNFKHNLYLMLKCGG